MAQLLLFQVKLVFSGMSNDLVLDIPFKLVHPAPNTEVKLLFKKKIRAGILNRTADSTAAKKT